MEKVTASVIAEHANGRIVGLDRRVHKPAPAAKAVSGDLTFVKNAEEGREALVGALSSGATVLAPPSARDLASPEGTLILVDNPRAAFAQTLARFFIPPRVPGIASSAVVHPGAQVDPTATVGHFSVIREGAVIGAGAEIRDHVIVGRNVQVGAQCLVKSHVVIGEEGFGIETDADGNNFPVPQIGSVILGDGVQLGNFTTVCSGALEPTTIAAFTKLSDHVHVAHNCHVGRNSIITAGVVFAGSVTVGDQVWIGPGVTIRDGMTIGDRAFIGIGSNVVKPIPAGERWAGNPARRFR